MRLRRQQLISPIAWFLKGKQKKSAHWWPHNRLHSCWGNFLSTGWEEKWTDSTRVVFVLACLWVDGQCDFSSASCIYGYPSWTQVSESQDEHTCCGTSTSEEFVFTSQRSNDQWDSASLVFSVEAQWPRSCCRTATTIRWQNESRICRPVGSTVEKKFWTCYTVQSPPLAAAWLTKLMFLVFQKEAAAPRSYSSCLCLQEKLTG